MNAEYRAIALTCGYAESQSSSWLIFWAEEKSPTTRQEALQSLVAYLWEKFSWEGKEAHNSSLRYHVGKKCCQDHWRKSRYGSGYKEDLTHCPKCSYNYPVWSFNEDDWQNFLINLQNSTCDSYGDHEKSENTYGWIPWRYDFSVPSHQMVIVAVRAEAILTKVLYELHSELQSSVEVDEEDQDPFQEEYDNLLDESCVFLNGNYGKPLAQD